MLRHGYITINFNWILLRQRWFGSLLNITSKACLSLSVLNCMEPPFIFLQLSSIWASPSTIISLFSSLSPATVKPAILNCAEWILSVTTCHKMLSRHWSQTFFLLFFRLESITAILYSLAVLRNSFINSKKFRTTLQGSSVKFLRLIIYLPSFTLFTGILVNKKLN